MNLYQPTVSGSLVVSGSIILSGSLNATQGITASFSGNATSASFATNAATAYTASSISNLGQNVQITGSLGVTSTITAQTLNVQTVTSSVVYSSGSNIFGNSISNTQTFTGSAFFTGSHFIQGNIAIGTSSINAWTNPFTVIQGGTFGQHIGFQSNAPDIKLGTNNFYNGLGYVYATSGSGAAQINVGGTSGFQVNLAPSGNTGATIPFTASLSIAQSGAATFSSTVDGTIFNSTSNAFRLNGNNALSLVTLNGQSVVKINAAGFWGVQLVGANDNGIVINNVGNVGIGTTSPADGLTIETNSNNYNALALRDSRAYNTSPEAALAFRLKYNSAGAYATPALFVAYKDNTTDGNQAGGIAFYTNPNSNVNERMRITSSGKIGMGVTNPEYLLDVADSSSNTLMAVRNTNTASSTAKNAMYGFLGTDTVGTVKAVGGMQAVTNDINWISGNLYWYVRSGDAQPLRMSLSSGGALVISGALTQNGSPSDINLKENLVKISSPLNKISQINGYTFEWKEGSPARDNISNIVEDAGVVAQEVETILPEIVRTSDDNKVVNYNGLVALLIEGMKEQQAQIEELKAIIQRNNLT